VARNYLVLKPGYGGGPIIDLKGRTRGSILGGDIMDLGLFRGDYMT